MALDFNNAKRAFINAKHREYGNHTVTEPRPKTCRAALLRFLRKQFRLLCFECGRMASITDVIDISDAPRSYTADVALSCGHSRNYTVSVHEKILDRVGYVKDDFQVR